MDRTEQTVEKKLRGTCAEMQSLGAPIHANVPENSAENEDCRLLSTPTRSAYTASRRGTFVRMPGEPCDVRRTRTDPHPVVEPVSYEPGRVFIGRQ